MIDKKQEKPKYRILGFYRETEFQDTPIGKMPKSWKITKLANVAQIIMGQSPPSSTYNEEGIGLPFLQGKAEFGTIFAKPRLYTSKPTKIAEKGDILISVRAPVGDVNIAPYRLCIGRGLAAIRFNPTSANAFFYFYYFQRIKPNLEALGKGTTFKAITRKELENLQVPLPPLEEQWGIAEVLSSVDQAIEAVDRLIQKLEHVKRVLMQELLTKGLGHKEFQDTPIGKIPKEWKIVKLGDVARVDTRAVMPTPGIKYYYLSLEDIENDTGRILKSPEDLTDGVEIKSTKYVFTANHVLYGRLRPYLNKVALPSRDGICSTDILPLLPNTRLILREYLAYVLLHQRFVEYATTRMKGTNHPRVKSQDVLNYRFPLPTMEEQQKIVQILSTISNWIEAEKIRNNKLKNIKNNLMNLLLTGAVRVVVEKEYEPAG